MSAKTFLTTCLGIVILLGLPLPVLAQEGDIQITTEEGVIINLDDDIKGKTTAEEGGMYIEDVSAGKHKVKAEKPGAGTLEATVMVQEGRTTEISMHFTSPPMEVHNLVDKKEVVSMKGVGNLVLRSVPLHASVYLDGKEMGSTDMEIRCVPAGRHEIKFVCHDDRVLQDSFLLRPGETLRLKGHFRKNRIFNASQSRDPKALSERLNRFLHTPILKSVQEKIRDRQEGS